MALDPSNNSNLQQLALKGLKAHALPNDRSKAAFAARWWPVAVSHVWYYTLYCRCAVNESVKQRAAFTTAELGLTRPAASSPAVKHRLALLRSPHAER